MNGHDWVYDDVEGTQDWSDKDKCQRCGDGDALLRAIPMKYGGRAKLCRDCVKIEIDRDNVHPDSKHLG